jgi:hypothetical protein
MGEGDADDWRRLKACPGCDYSLETLPSEGTCPECGRRYDQRFVVLTGSGRGMNDNAAGGTWRGTASQSAWVLIIVWVFAAGRRGMTDPQLIGWGVIGAIALASQLYARLFSAREPRMQLWLSPDGAAQVASTPEARRAQWVSANVGWSFLPIALGVIFFESGLRPGVITWCVIAAVILGAGAWWWRRGRRGGASEGVDYTPALWPWGRIERIEVKVLPRERARVRCRMMRRWAGINLARQWMIDIEIECGAGEAEGLRRQMLRWAGRPDGEE